MNLISYASKQAFACAVQDGDIRSMDLLKRFRSRVLTGCTTLCYREADLISGCTCSHFYSEALAAVHEFCKFDKLAPNREELLY